MEKLELKHLAPYLPYDLPIEPLYQSMGGFHNRTLDIDVLSRYELEDIKPILRPLSDLTKEIEVNGEKFVPSERLRMYENYHGKIFFEIGGDWELKGCIQDVQKLFEYHFDVFGLIEKGLAIDINTLT